MGADRKEYPDLEEDRALADTLRRQRPDLSQLSDAALVARARSMGPYERLVWRGEVQGTLAGAISPGVLAQVLGPHDPSLVIQITGHAGDVDSAAPAFALWELSAPSGTTRRCRARSTAASTA